MSYRLTKIKKKCPNLSWTKTCLKLSILLNRSCNFDVLVDLESSEPYVPTFFLRIKTKHLIHLPLWTITTFMTDKHTYRRTWRLNDQPGPERWVCENLHMTAVAATTPLYSLFYTTDTILLAWDKLLDHQQKSKITIHICKPSKLHIYKLWKS